MGACISVRIVGTAIVIIIKQHTYTLNFHTQTQTHTHPHTHKHNTHNTRSTHSTQNTPITHNTHTHTEQRTAWQMPGRCLDTVVGVTGCIRRCCWEAPGTPSNSIEGTRSWGNCHTTGSGTIGNTEGYTKKGEPCVNCKYIQLLGNEWRGGRSSQDRGDRRKQ
jgi:L,D-peptidoglycan transpeptidase YkuD (ErfK/YbiS/YcfS/YnhG family)